MASLRAFCLPSELVSWLHELMTGKKLDALTFQASELVGELVEAPETVGLPVELRRAFLFPASTVAEEAQLKVNDIKVRSWGWVDVRPGRIAVHEGMRVMTPSELHAEDFAGAPVRPAKYIRWLARRLQGELTYGVVGTNIVHGGEATYGDIAHTDGARGFYDKGGVWKQFLDGNVVLSPVA